MNEQAQRYGARDRERAGDPARPDGRRLLRRMGLGLGRRADRACSPPGVNNRRPPMDEELHDEALARGLIRYCPICDGYEVTDKKVGVIGSGSPRRRRGGLPARLHRRRHPDRARQARTTSTPKTRRSSKARGIARVDGPCQAVAHLRRSASSSIRPRAITRSTASIPRSARDTHTQLAGQLGARSASDRCIGVDAHQRTSVPGLYAAGDVVHRPRPDQPRDGRRRRRRDDDPQRSGKERPMLR